MANKWEITLDVTEEEKELLVRGLDELEAGPAATIVALKSQITLAWIEKDVEIVPPPSEWSAHSSVAVGSDVLRRDAPYPLREMKRRRHSGEGKEDEL